MFFLVLRVVFSTAFSHTLRLSQARVARPMRAAAVNYLVAAIVCLAWVTTAPLGWAAATLGSLAGATYVSSLVLILPTMRRSGVSVVGALTQLSMLAPVGYAIWRFGEIPTAAQWVGVALSLAALPILSRVRAVAFAAESAGKTASWTALLPWALFASACVSNIVMKEFSTTRPGAELPCFSAALFAAATLCTWGWMALTGDVGRPDHAALPSNGRRMGEWPVGLALGAANVLQLVCMLLALRELPAVVAFPASAALGIACNAGASLVLWKERPGATGWLGIALSIAAVLLLGASR